MGCKPSKKKSKMAVEDAHKSGPVGNWQRTGSVDRIGAESHFMGHFSMDQNGPEAGEGVMRRASILSKGGSNSSSHDLGPRRQSFSDAPPTVHLYARSSEVNEDCSGGGDNAGCDAFMDSHELRKTIWDQKKCDISQIPDYL
ncbi:hypothetical protein HDE_00763 [Halotydeus destructor]|nr:hypothetical protein HDE_05302 [Halotydeus destructor]KAI1307340.1 hypothetical protein HDE_00763 [Halotydeus destructor]